MNAYRIEVKDLNGDWYTNAIIYNDYDAIRVAQFYRDTLHYFVRLFCGDDEVTFLLDSGVNARVYVKGGEVDDN